MPWRTTSIDSATAASLLLGPNLFHGGKCQRERERERESLFARKKHTWHNKTMKILRAGCQKGHSPSCWPPMIYNVLYLTHIEGDITESPKT